MGDIESLCAMESGLRLKRSPPQAGLEPGTARSASQRLICRATGASVDRRIDEWSFNVIFNSISVISG